MLQTCIYHHELDRFPILQEFLDPMDGEFNKCDLFLYPMTKYVNIWMTWTAQQTNIFQLTHAQCIKPYLNEGSIQSASQIKGFEYHKVRMFFDTI